MSAILKQSLKPLEKYLNQRDLVEVCINQPGEVWLESKDGTWSSKKDSDLTLSRLLDIGHLLATYSGQDFSDKNPGLACQLPDYGYRIQIVSGSSVDTGIMFSIRVGASRLFDIDSYMNKEDADKLISAVKTGKCIVVSGGTSSGKTTFMNSLTRFIPDHSRIVVIEDTKELLQHHKNFVRYIKSKSGTDISQTSYKDIINWTMRTRPDRIIVGELTTDNTASFLRLMNTGHAGGMTTLHAENFDRAIDAIEMNASLSGELHGDKVRDYALKAIDIIVQLKRVDSRKIMAETKFL